MGGEWGERDNDDAAVRTPVVATAVEQRLRRQQGGGGYGSGDDGGGRFDGLDNVGDVGRNTFTTEGWRRILAIGDDRFNEIGNFGRQRRRQFHVTRSQRRTGGGRRTKRIVTYMSPFADKLHVWKEHCAVEHQEGASWLVYLYHCPMD